MKVLSGTAFSRPAVLWSSSIDEGRRERPQAGIITFRFSILFCIIVPTKDGIDWWGTSNHSETEGFQEIRLPQGKPSQGEKHTTTPPSSRRAADEASLPKLIPDRDLKAAV